MTIDINALPNLQRYDIAAGLLTQLGTLVPSGSRVCAYVRSTGRQSNDPIADSAPIFTTLNAGLAQSRGYGDVVVVLPGHTENVSTADQMSNLVAGTRIIGLGYGTLRPTLTWSAATATFLFDVANTVLANFNLYLAGDPTSTTALSVAAPITVSAAGCAIIGCDIQFAVDADQRSTIGITTTAAADDFTIANCFCDAGTSDGTGITTHIRLVGADRFRMRNCVIQGATSSTTVGVVQFLTTASLNVQIENCVFINRKAASIHALTGMAGATGIVKDCGFGILDDATLAGLVTPGDLMGFNNRTVNLAGEQGGLTTTVSA
jgi:hypothetical protein